MDEKIRKIDLLERIIWKITLVCFSIPFVSAVAWMIFCTTSKYIIKDCCSNPFSNKNILLFVLFPALIAAALDTVRWRLFFWGWRLEDQIRKEAEKK